MLTALPTVMHIILCIFVCLFHLFWILFCIFCLFCMFQIYSASTFCTLFCIFWLQLKPMCLLFLAHLSHWFMMSYCNRWMSVVHHGLLCVINNCSKWHLLNYFTEFWPNFVGMILIWPCLKMVQIVQVHCISRSHRLKMNLQDENFKNLLLWKHMV